MTELVTPIEEILGEPLLAALFVAELLSVALGIAIAIVAYRGYRRNQSKPMLFIAAGFILVFAVPFSLFLVIQALPGMSEILMAFLTAISQLVGLSLVLYALWV